MGGAHNNPQVTALNLKEALIEELDKLVKIKPDKLVELRIEKFGRMGEYVE